MVQLTWIGDTDGNTDLAGKGFSVNEIDDDGRLEGIAVLSSKGETVGNFVGSGV